MTNGRLIIALLVGLCVGSPKMIRGEGGTALVAKSQSNASGNAYSATGKVKIDLREVQTETMGATGIRPLSVLILFEPSSGAFTWRVFEGDPNTSWRISQFKDGQAAFLKGGQLIDFMALVSPTRLIINESHGHASNMDDAQAKAFSAAGEAINPRGALDDVQGFHTVSLVSLGRDFVSPPMSAQIGPSPKVLGVRWDGQHWIVTLKAQRTEAITLDAHYNLVSMKEVK